VSMTTSGSHRNGWGLANTSESNGYSESLGRKAADEMWQEGCMERGQEGCV
jgi:hypothetical protein